MKRIILLTLAAFLALASPAFAANCASTAYARTAGNWSGASTFNDASPGGVACTLTTGNAVVFDANTGAGTYTIDGSFSIASFDASASPAVTLTQNAGTVTVTGTAITFNSTIIFNGINAARIWSANPTGTNTLTITSAGQRFGALTVNGATGATVTLADALRVDAAVTTSILTITQGIFNANNQNVTIGNFNSSNSNTRTITMGSGTWNVVGDDSGGNTWDTSTVTGLTLQKNTSTLSFTSTSAINRSFFAGNPAGGYNIVNFAANSSGSAINILGGPTFATLTATAPMNIRIANGTTLTVSSAFSLLGSSSNQFLVASSSFGNTASISVGSGSPSFSWTALFNIICTGGATFAASSSFNLGGNTGCNISAPTGGGGRIIGG